MFGQFVLTSRRGRPIYDPVGKYYGVFLFCAVGVTLLLPYAAVRQALLVPILGFTVASLTSRAMSCLLAQESERPARTALVCGGGGEWSFGDT